MEGPLPPLHIDISYTGCGLIQKTQYPKVITLAHSWKVHNRSPAT